MSIADKLTTLNDTKAAIKAALVARGIAVADTDSFRSYADKINDMTNTKATFTPTITLTSASTAEDKLAYIAETKKFIGEAIAIKGVAVADTDNFRSYADKIATIQTGTITGIALISPGGGAGTWENYEGAQS